MIESDGWILGVFFFVFIFFAIGFILKTNVTVPPVLPSNGNIPSIDEPAASDPNHFQCDYRIEIPPQVFVRYPFGIRIVFAKQMERAAAQAQRGFEARDYVRWSPPTQDPHLRLEYGQIDFQTSNQEPVIRVELKSSPDIFEPTVVSVDHKLDRNLATECSLWLTPLQERTSTLSVVFSQVGSNGTGIKKLATHPIQVSTESFPIRLR